MNVINTLGWVFAALGLFTTLYVSILYADEVDIHTKEIMDLLDKLNDEPKDSTKR